MKRAILMLLIACTLSIGIGGCGGHRKEAEEQAQVVANAFETGNEQAINEIIFGIGNLDVDNGISELWGEDATTQEGPLACVFDLTSIRVKGSTDKEIEYEISAPDMSGVFESMMSDDSDISEDELLDHIRKYALNAETRTTTVSLEYTLVDDKVVVNYQDEKFINAITGGLLEAYQDLYAKMLEDYAKGVSE